jgi:alanyl-tRNA synthetase
VVPKAEVTVRELRRQVSAASAIPLDEIHRLIEPYEKVYTSLDYSKAIAFIVAEGVVPSNVKTGYLVRLLIRRAFRVLKQVGAEENLLELVNLQIDFWKKDFPHLEEMRDEVLEIVGHEISKFKETIARGMEAVSRDLRSLKKSTQQLSVEA